MANTDKLFRHFNSNENGSCLRLTDARRKKLRDERKALENKILKYFKEEKPNEIQPTFAPQGSLPMDTIVNPIVEKETDTAGVETEKRKYDVDDGVYFEGNESPENRKSIQTYHDWVINAIGNHTQEVISKTTCVRVVYSDGHHIDLPIYYLQDETPELAHKSKGWIKSAPEEFMDWFNNKVEENSQLRRLVRYLKGWTNYKNCENSSIKMPSGMIMTVLGAENASYHDREDIALKDTLINIQNYIDSNGVVCYRPTTPEGENLFEDYNDTQKNHFKKSLKAFVESAKQAIELSNEKDAALKWQKHFGDRFPVHLAEDGDSEADVYEAPAIIKRDAGSA